MLKTPQGGDGGGGLETIRKQRNFDDAIETRILFTLSLDKAGGRTCKVRLTPLHHVHANWACKTGAVCGF
jgi:hypothetical protein